MSAQIAAPPALLLKKIRTLIEMHDNYLMMNRMGIVEFCMAQDKGLIQVLIVLDDSADEIGFEYDDKEIIRQMLEIVPDKLKELEKLAGNSAEKTRIEKEVKHTIYQFIKKPCKAYVRKFAPTKAPSKEEGNTIGTTIKGRFRDPGSHLDETQPVGESRLEAGENLLEKMEKIKKVTKQFLELTDLLLEIRTGVYLCVSSDDKYSKAISISWVRSCANFKKEYRQLISDIRNDIPDIPDNEWEPISATDAKLSVQIDKLIDDFNNITDRRTEIDSTMNNLRREYKKLWQEIFRNILAESSTDIDRVMAELREISPTSHSTDLNDSKLSHVLELLQKISDLGLKKAISYSRFEQYDRAAEQYRVIATAYSEAYSKMIHPTEKPGNEQRLLQSLLKSVRYWQRQEDDAMETYNTSQVTKYKNEGEELLARGLYSEALESFDEALKFKPSIHTSDIWIKKGNTYSYLDRFDEAIPCYDKALSINQNNGDAWYNKGKCFIELKKYEDARKCFDRAIDIYPNDYGAWWGKGNSLYFMGRYAEASICFDNAIAINPREHILWYNKGMIFFQRGELDEAPKYLEKALEINPDSFPVRAALAEILLLKRDYDNYERLVKEMSDLPESHNYEFGMRVLDVIYMYLNNRAKVAMKATMDLLDYYESIAEEPSSDLSFSNWNFRNLQRMIEKSDLVPEKKSLLLSLMALPSGDPFDLDNLRNMTQRIYNDDRKDDQPTDLVKPMRIKDLDVRVVNTWTPREDREGWYNWEIHIEPEDVLSQINYVQYTLHPTFYDPTKKIEKREGGFKLEASGWGEFNIKVQIALKNGKTI